MNRAAIDFESIDDDLTRETLLTVRNLAISGKTIESSRLLPDFRFEFDMVYLDSNPENFFSTTSYSIAFDKNNPNHAIRIETEADTLLLSVTMVFEADLKEGIDEVRFNQWLITNEVWAHGTISANWSYASDEGGELRLV